MQNEISHFSKRKRMRQKCLIFFIFQILKGIVCNMQCKMRLILLFCIIFLLLLLFRKKYVMHEISVFFKKKNHFCFL